MSEQRFRLADLVSRLGGEILGDPELVVHQVASLRSARAGQIAFVLPGKFRDELAATAASAVIVAASDRDATSLPRIVCDDPYGYFARVSGILNPAEPIEAGVHPSAVVAADAIVARDAGICAHAVVGPGARVGAGASVGAGCVIGAGVHIGAQSRIAANVTVYAGCQIGERVVVHSGAVIGADGFGFAPIGGKWLKIPQLGRVVIGSDVEIGANTTVDRGALDDTVIEDGVKIDNLVQIGHNCRIGAHTAIAGCVGIAGSTTIGQHCMIGGAAMIGGHLEIGDRVVVAGGSAVTKSLPEAGSYMSTWPAGPAREWRRAVAGLRTLDRMRARIVELEQRLARLESRE